MEIRGWSPLAFSSDQQTYVQKAKLTLDGRDIATIESPSGEGQVTLEGNASVDRSTSRTLRVFILQQTSSPNPYSAIGSITTQDRILDLAPAQAVLKTGESIEVRVAF